MNPQNYNPNQPQKPYGDNNFPQNTPYPPNEVYGNSVNNQGVSNGYNNLGYQNGPMSTEGYQTNNQQTNLNNHQQPNMPPRQDYSVSQTQNPYSIEYLNSIAPKPPAKFWTRGKIFLAIFAAIGTIFSLWFIIFGNSGNVSNKEATVNLYFHIVKIRTISEKYRQKLSGTDLSAINAGMITSLKADQVALEKYMTNKKIAFSSEKKLAKSAAYNKISESYSETEKKLNDAFLNTTINGVYAREMSYSLSVVKGNILKLEKRLGKKSSETLDPIIVNFDTLIKALDDFKE